MLCLTAVGSAASPSVGLGMLSPDGAVYYDFGVEEVFELDDERQILAVASGDPAAVTFSPALERLEAAEPLAANAKQLARIRRRLRPAPVVTRFKTGYNAYARDRARFWRKHGVGPQPLLAAGVFSLSSIRTPITTALKLFAALGPAVRSNTLPRAHQLAAIVRAAGAGLDSVTSGRPRWFLEYEAFRARIVALIGAGLRDDELRRALAVTGTAWEHDGATHTGLPYGLGLAKLSFTLALVGQNLGCLDARILRWAYTKDGAARFISRMSRTTRQGTVTEAAYSEYRRAEEAILMKSPFYRSADPVGLARAQWLLWEALGAEDDRTHTHEELFEAVVDRRVAAL